MDKDIKFILKKLLELNEVNYRIACNTFGGLPEDIERFYRIYDETKKILED